MKKKSVKFLSRKTIHPLIHPRTDFFPIILPDRPKINYTYRAGAFHFLQLAFYFFSNSQYCRT